MSDATLAALCGLAGVVITALVGRGIATRKAKSDSATTGFTQSFELSKYIRDQVATEVAAQTKPLRDQIAALQRVVGSLYDLRDAFRDFYRDTKEKLGDHTPPLDAAILRQLEETDDDTKTGRMMNEIRESIRQQDEEKTEHAVELEKS